MKKIVLFGCALMLASHGIYAQTEAGTAKREPMFGVEGGINLNNMLDHYQGETTSNQLKVGFHAGVIGDIMLTDHVYFQPGVRYIMKGGQQERSMMLPGVGGMTEIETKEKVTLNYVDVPLNIVVKFGGDDSRFFIGAGGYVSALLDARTKFKTETTTANEGESKVDGTRKLSIGNNDGDEITRMDYGVNGLIGWQMRNHWYVKGSVSAGLRNIASERDLSAWSSITPTATGSSKNISYLLTVGYMFER